MAATLTLCASRKMLSYVCLLRMPLAFHCSMLNVLSDMVGGTRLLKYEVSCKYHVMVVNFIAITFVIYI